MHPMFHIFKSIFPAFAMSLLLSACSAVVNWDYPRMPSKAFAHPETSSVGALFQEAADQHPSLSGFSLVPHGENAFLARLAMADLAEKTLDAQYYIWDSDTTGRILASRLMRAANRGVRVRILIDDHYQTGARLSAVAALDGHPLNIKVRLFNPITNRFWRTMSFLVDFAASTAGCTTSCLSWTTLWESSGGATLPMFTSAFEKTITTATSMF